MSLVAGKRYVKALLSSFDKSELLEVSKNLTALSTAFGNAKFKNIITSPDVSVDKKVEFLLSLVENPSQKFQNFIKLVVQNGRMEELPAIAKSLNSEMAKMSGEYEGVLLSNFKVESNQIEEIENSISKKLGSKIKLSNLITDYPGIKVEIDDLGVEVGISVDRLESQLAEYILKAI
jgi:F-type H+-transporting ATPase subunit delta